MCRANQRHNDGLSGTLHTHQHMCVCAISKISTNKYTHTSTLMQKQVSTNKEHDATIFLNALLKVDVPSSTAESLACYAGEHSISPSQKRKLVANFRQSPSLVERAVNSPPQEIFSWTTSDMRSTQLTKQLDDYCQQKRKWRTLNDDDDDERTAHSTCDTVKEEPRCAVQGKRCCNNSDVIHTSDVKHAPDSCNSSDLEEEGSNYEYLLGDALIPQSLAQEQPTTSQASTYGSLIR